MGWKDTIAPGATIKITGSNGTNGSDLYTEFEDWARTDLSSLMTQNGDGKLNPLPYTVQALNGSLQITLGEKASPALAQKLERWARNKTTRNPNLTLSSGSNSPTPG